MKLGVPGLWNPEYSLRKASMRIPADRLALRGLLVATVFFCVACADESGPNSGRSDPGPPPDSLSPAWASDSACIPDAAERTLNSDQFRNALICSVPDFQWPEGKYPDIDWIMGAEEGSPFTWNYDIGMEHTQLGRINACAWYSTWLDARRAGNTSREQKALTHVADVIPNFETTISGFPPNRRNLQRYDDLATAALLGDPSPVQRFVELRCSSIPLIPSPPTSIADLHRPIVPL